MRDPHSSPIIKSLHPAVAQEAESIINEAETRLRLTTAIRVTQGLRTMEEQAALYAKGRTSAGPRVTNASPGESYHNYGLALDFALLHDKDGNGTYEEIDWNMTSVSNEEHQTDWMEVVNAFLKARWFWGGNFHSLKDNPHFEKTFGLNWRELQRRYNNGEFIPDTKYVRL